MVTTADAPLQGRPLLLAGIRLTGSAPHLGTFYGWIRPVTRAAESMRVCVLIADHQSLEHPRDEPIREQASRLEATLRELLPADVSIVRESAVPSLTQLGFLAAQLFADHHLRRVAPLRKLHAAGQPITMPVLLYPAMMIANVLAFGATHVLSKPESRFHHADVLNDVLTRAAHHYGWPPLRLSLVHKPKVDIPSGDGSGRPMKRDRPGALFIPVGTGDRIDQWAKTLPTPDQGSVGIQRFTDCGVVRPIWDSIDACHPAGSPTARRIAAVRWNCVNNTSSCSACVGLLTNTITDDMAQSRSRSPGRPSVRGLVQAAEQEARRLIRLAMDGDPQ